MIREAIEVIAELTALTLFGVMLMVVGAIYIGAIQ